MTGAEVALLQLGILVFAIMLGFPVAYTLMALGVGFGYYAYYDAALFDRVFARLAGEDPSTFDNVWAYFGTLFSNRIFDLFVNQTYSVMSNDVLTAIPLFLFMGYIVERANIVNRLFHALQIASRNVPGSLAVAALITCALFATATGIVGAVVTLMGLLALPSMLRSRYDVSFATGAICAGGTLGILIPPSIMLIVYGATASVSVVRLYAGALIPGFLLAGLYVAYVITRASLNKNLAPPPPKEDTEGITGAQIFIMLVTSFFPLALLILAVLGAILFGFATPSEAAALGALGGILLAIAYRALTWERLTDSIYLTVRTTAMVCWLFVGSSTFASVFAYLGGQEMIGSFVRGLDMSPLQFLLLAQVIIFLLGWPLEWTEIIIIFVPIFLPLLAHFNIDPLFFGILIALNLQTAFLSPPMAMSAYYLKGVSPPEVRLSQIFNGCMPYMGLVVLSMIIVYMFPQTIYWLPSLVYGRSIPMPGARFVEMNAVALRDEIARGAVKAVEVAEAFLARVAEREPEVQAFEHLDPAYVMHQAEALDRYRGTGRTLGPLHGLPVGLKDIIDTRDYPTENGTVFDKGRRPRQDAAVVDRLREAGAIVFGKTVTTELAVFTPGKTRNPHDKQRTPGGSSSGSAAAVGADMVPLAVGTQTNGSVIRPASFCGVVGFKPTRGLISRRGILPQSATLDQVGTFSRTIEDAALLAETLAGYDERDAGTRMAARPQLHAIAAARPPVRPSLAFVRTPVWDSAGEEVREGLAELFSALGEKVDAIELPDTFAQAHAWHRAINMAELAQSYGHYYDRDASLLSDRLRGMVEEGRAVGAVDYLAALEGIALLNAALDLVFDSYDAIVTPAAPGEAPLGMATGDPAFSTIWTYCGVPALTLPLLSGPNDMPVGVQLVGRRLYDGRLLRTARWLTARLEENARGADISEKVA